MMTHSARDITLALGGDWMGQYGLVPDIGHSSKDRGLKIWDAPELTGGVAVHSFHGNDFREVRDALASQGYLPALGKGERLDPTEIEKRRIEAERRTREIEARSRKYALTIWRRSAPMADTIAARYLRSRGIGLGPFPSLRYSASLKHKKTGRKFPAMVAGVQAPDGQLTGLHRTYLQSNGEGKADVTPDKAMLGPCIGGAVRFAAPQVRLAVGEGIETCLSFSENTGLPVWAALSTAGLRNLVLPDVVKAVVIAADRDATGAGERAANDAAERWHSEGRAVEIVLPPEGFKDFNDAARAKEKA